LGSDACGGTYVFVQSPGDVVEYSEATADTYIPSGKEALLVSVLGGGIMKRGANTSLPTGFSLACAKINQARCSDTWRGPNSCSVGEWNFVAASAYHVAAFASVRYTGDTSDSDQCYTPSLIDIIVTIAGGTGGDGSTGGGDTGADTGEGNVVVTVEPGPSSACDSYTVEFLELGDDGSVISSKEMTLEVC
jgi:hypothetical protein